MSVRRTTTAVMLLAAAVAAPAPTDNRVLQELVALERSALDRWVRADPQGYLDLFAPEPSYFDPTTERRVDGLEAMQARLAPMKNVKLPFTDPRYEIINPRVQRQGDVAVLSFNLAQYGRVGDRPEALLSRWNSTEVYQRLGGRWRIVHSHWSQTTPPAPTAPAPSADAAPKRTGEQIEASFAAHKGEFDYLLGDWEFTGTNQQYGKIRGFWSAMRLDEGQILDEYRVVGDQGETYYVTSTLRNYNGALDRWELVGADGGAGLQDVGTGQWDGKEMKIEQTFGVAAGTPSRWRIRYHAIGSDRFSWAADRSADDGKTWVANFQQLEARRIGPARSMAALTTAKRPATASPAP